MDNYLTNIIMSQRNIYWDDVFVKRKENNS